MFGTIGSEWDAAVGPGLLLVPVLVCAATSLCLLLFCVFWRRKNKTKNCLSEIDILHAIKDAKIFPVDQSNGWILHDYINGQQVWRHDIGYQCHSQCTFTAFACYSKVKGSSQMVLNLLKDSLKHEHWTLNPRPVLKQELMPDDIKNSGLQSGCHDVIGIEMKSYSNCYLTTLLTKFAAQFRSVKKMSMLERFWQREENGCCWLLECDTDSNGWNFCLMQPFEGWFETDRCMLTCVSCFGKPQKKADYESIAIKLCSIRDYLQYRRIQCIPLVRLSLNYCDNENAPVDISSVPPAGVDKIKPQKESKSSTRDSLQEISILQKFRNMIEVKRELYEMGRRQKTSTVAVGQNQKTEASSSHASIQNPLDLFRKLAPSKSTDQLRDKMETEGPKSNIEKSLIQKSDENERKKEITDDKKKTEGRISNLRRRVPLLNEIGRVKSVEKESDGSRALEMSNDPENVLQKNCSFSEELLDNSIISNSENPTDQNTNENMVVQLKQMTEATAVELVLEKCKVSHLNLNSSRTEQARSCGGWTYCGLEKDTVILKKATEESSTFQSYLGKGMVHLHPDIVFDVLRNTQSRTAYDDLLQRAEILQEFQCGMKIVYLYYELHQMPKKCYDACLLQGEKIEGKKCIITLQSIEWPKCKELENVTRVKITSSGWIIEPVYKGKEVFTMITYISQMDEGPSHETLIMENLSAKQPLCIPALRQYLMKQKESCTEQQQKELS